MLAFKNILTGGSQDGSLIFWDEKELDNHHRKSTNQYVQHIYDTFEKNKVENPNLVFRYSSFSSEFLNKYGAQANADFDFNLNEDLNNKHNSQIVDIIPNIKNNQDLEIFSLEEFGKIIQWNIIELNKEESEMQYIEFGHYSKIKVISPQIIDLNQLGCHANLIAKNMTMDYDENIYVCSSAGILKINKHGSNRTKYPKQYHEILSNSEQPTTVSTCGNSQLFIAGYSDGQINFNDDIQQLDPQQVRHNNQVIEVDFINYYQTVMGEDNNEL
ncbi:WD40-repeat-containing domain [Pseudocohnilembus persalinus]|uniref:WD40-repeat-containing domain n=1 Tax=Pseudocohnilembus persalinus TaxID=266149 RepID=A0A0V0QPE0_PSEPJ|nr:WD40-repeat-containing domain [Pseudocohnilembus persalinus]|eukprot:KRX03928.1 WD40-repeat-containing domain [Pseudocohnilembus persalinus]